MAYEYAFAELRALLALSKSKRAQGSIEYIMMLSAVSIVIVVALAMVTQLKGAALHAFSGGSSNSIARQLSSELANLTNAT